MLSNSLTRELENTGKNKLMETKIDLIQCESCEKAFSVTLIKHYETGNGEADYCDNCADILEAQYA